MAIFADLMAAIPAYTGLSPIAFFTIAALVMAVYYLVSGFFAAPKHASYVPMEPLPTPVQLGDVTEEELRAYDGNDPSKPLLMAIKGQIYDVTQSRMFYGPGGPYALFAGKDASRALAKMSFEEQDLNGNLEGLGAYEMDALQDWEWKFMSKYVKVGQITGKEIKSREVPVEDTSNAAGETDEGEKPVAKEDESEKPVAKEDERANEEGDKSTMNEDVEKVNEEGEKTILKEETASAE
ncbi:hypothetical protein GOP47_0006718 [Adiantum capillus-veneris]|uniref:Cytochrome b5 heme-binding domain-containing protein n=1 Tax=Adiantum capillus-veneris TaxID=13818 RepID=A0A9D4V4Y8_ADICA|nr:hypothetical protein GOP47_0006109 [Adiantum capillus-veneris]KAI5079047.1 hypothetical protein GOP47_0006718 [Adiantum capillus-veneris]